MGSHDCSIERLTLRWSAFNLQSTTIANFCSFISKSEPQPSFFTGAPNAKKPETGSAPGCGLRAGSSAAATPPPTFTYPSEHLPTVTARFILSVEEAGADGGDGSPLCVLFV